MWELLTAFGDRDHLSAIPAQAASEMSKSDEPGKEIWFVNRSVVILRPKGPFVRWVIKTAAADHVPSKEFVESASNAFLIPEFEWEGEAHAWLQENCRIMFDLMLADWIPVPASWPPDRGWPTFREWFRIEHIDMAWDLVDDVLSSDPPDEVKEAE